MMLLDWISNGLLLIVALFTLSMVFYARPGFGFKKGILTVYYYDVDGNRKEIILKIY